MQMTRRKGVMMLDVSSNELFLIDDDVCVLKFHCVQEYVEVW